MPVVKFGRNEMGLKAPCDVNPSVTSWLTGVVIEVVTCEVAVAVIVFTMLGETSSSCGGLVLSDRCEFTSCRGVSLPLTTVVDIGTEVVPVCLQVCSCINVCTLVILSRLN